MKQDIDTEANGSQHANKVADCAEWLYPTTTTTTED
jgi:hypothetical protein